MRSCYTFFLFLNGIIQALAATSGRLRQVTLSMDVLGLQQTLPVDPSGKDGPKRVAGYFKLNRTEEAEMFYFFFESRKNPDSDPVVLWMTGGPGCSSELAVFYENGPFKINEDLTLSENEFGWDDGHNVIYVDQPIGTGFSYSNSHADTVYNEKGVAHDMIDFLNEWRAANPQFADNELYITGESYAGHYVPAVAHRVWRWNKDGEGKPFAFKGLAIGNGLTDPAIQYGAYADYGLENNLISEKVHKRIAAAYPDCKFGIDTCNAHNIPLACKAALAYCQTFIFGQLLMAAGNVNVYDIRKKCHGALCYDFSLLEKYLAQPDVRAALGVGDRYWSTCDPVVHGDMMGDWMLDYAELLPEMLADDVRVMIYAGDQDLICNWLGNRRWVDALPWSQSKDWEASKDMEWSVDSQPAALVRQVGPLSFVKVYDAGHMVPMDQGKVSLQMLEHLTYNKQFSDGSS